MPVAFNTGPQPVVIDAEGRQIAGRDWGNVNPDDPSVASALASGALVLRDTPPQPDDSPRARAVYAAAAGAEPTDTPTAASDTAEEA